MSLYTFKHTAKKLVSTTKICYTLFMARTFGKYEYSTSTDFDYAVYKWHGKEWAIPTSEHQA